MTDRPSLESMMGDALHRLRVDLDGHHHVVDLSEAGEQRVRSAIEWLLTVRNEEGYWGYRSPAATATCVSAIALWRPVEAPSLLRVPAEWLLGQADDARWETVWDTGAAIAAVFAAGAGDDPRARAAARRLAEQDPAVCTGRPHHAAQVLATGQVADWAPAKKERWCRQIEEDIDVAAGPYVVGQAVYALLAVGRPVGDLRPSLNYLADYLERTPTSTAAFLHHAAALRALARAGSHPDAVDGTIDDFFGAAYRGNGSWYHEPWYTAWALLALHEANSVRRVVVEQPRLDDYLATADQRAIEVGVLERRREVEERSARLAVAGATCGLVLGLAAAAFAVFAMPESNRLFTSGAAIGVVTPAVALAGRRLWQLLRS